MNLKKFLYSLILLLIFMGLCFVDAQGGFGGGFGGGFSGRGTGIPAENLRPVVIASKDVVQNCSPRWSGERLDDGRPNVPNELIERLKHVSITEAWSATNSQYPNSYTTAIGWTVMYPDEVICGRVLTAQYMPSNPDYDAAIKAQGQKEGRIGDENSWPIDMLQKGDVYVADGFGKILDGTLIGDNLGNSIYAKSGNGVIFNASIRDLEGLEAIKGFNAWYKGADPSFLRNVMLMGINVPIRIGDAVACPGDVVLAKKEGIVFIPAHMVEQVVTSSERTRVRDMFGHQRLIEGKYTPGQIDGAWSAEINADFANWLKEDADRISKEQGIPKDVVENMASGGTRGGAGGGGTRGGAGGGMRGGMRGGN
jgi:4-hydroxy-4-methyl-2-oxoglutarate aldolase